MAEFQTCSCCAARWASRSEFIDDPRTELIGYQADFLDLTGGYLLFTHTPDDCGSTMALAVERFTDLYEGARRHADAESLFGTAECCGRCGRIDDLQRCERPCRNAWVRELLQRIVERKTDG
jgi:hypothetical protein